MNCLKCGKETPEAQVFCDSCLETMQAFPVKPGTPVLLPPKQRSSPERHAVPRTPELSTAQQLQQLRRMVRWLTVIIAILSVLLCATALMLMQAIDRPTVPTPTGIGKNYTTSTGLRP